MKIILFGMLLVSLGIKAQERTRLENLCTGAALAYSEVMSKSPLTSIIVRNEQTKEEWTTNAVILADDKEWYTVLIIKINNDLPYVLGYQPGKKENHFDGYGEFTCVKREKGEVINMGHYYVPLLKFSKNNESLEYLQYLDYVVVVREKFDVQYFQLTELQRTYFLPLNYPR